MGKPFVIGIAGGTASGKSTLCEKLETELKGIRIKTFHMDKYFRPKAQRPYTKAFVTGKSYVDDNHPLTMDLRKLADDIKSIPGTDYDAIIIEGLLTLWDDEIYELLDLKLFVDCKSDERIVRRLKRNMQWGLTFDEISGVYLDMVRYRHDEYVEPSKWRADIIVNGSNFSEKALNLIKECIINGINHQEKNDGDENTKYYNKLVRDNIISIIENNGEKAVYETLGEEAYVKELNKKLVEEVDEFLKENTPEEIADIFEVLYAIMKSKNMEIGEIEKLRLRKKAERGGFDSKLFLQKVIQGNSI